MDGILTIRIEGSWSSADTSNINTGSFTTDSTRYPVITTDSANRFDGAYDSGKYRLDGSIGWNPMVALNGNYCRVIGLQIRNSGTTSQSWGVRFVGNYNVLDSCLVYGCPNASNIYDAGEGNVVANSVSKGSGVSGIEKAENGGTFYIYNSVSIANTTYGIRGAGYQTVSCVNDYCGGNGSDDYSRPANATVNTTTCFSEDGTLSTSTAAYSTSTFANVTASSEDVALASGSGLINQGTSLSSDSRYPFTWDCTNATRTGTWDVGAVEYVSTGGGVTIPRIIHHLRMQGVAA